MNKTIVTLSLSAVFMMAAGGSSAQESAEEQVESRDHHSKFKHKRKRMHEYMLKRVDSNEDGKIDLNEYLANAEKRFQNMDLNSDGFVTSEEHGESRKVMREKHREMREKRREARRAADKTTQDDDNE